jgi:hypothetical protein
MLNLAGPVLLYLLPLVVLAIIFSSTPNADAIEVVGLYCPYPYMASSILHYNTTYDRSLWLPVYGQVSEERFVRWVLFAGFVHLALTAAIIYATVRRFDRLVQRAPQELPTSPMPGMAGAPA